uniref:Uncharacterized protein n=1 Tax=Ciona savignyi TaxID=51511 RepID=H2YRW0_CIOSA
MHPNITKYSSNVVTTKPTTQTSKVEDESTLTPALIATLSMLAGIFLIAVAVRIWSRCKKYETGDSVRNSSTRSYLYDWY